MSNWFVENLVDIIGVVFGGFISYHVYFLSKKINLKDKLAHNDNIRKRIEPILEKIHKGRNSKIELINIKKYLTHYPHNNEENRYGYTYLGAELKAAKFDGVEFFCGIREVYKNIDGTLTLRQGDGSTQEDYNVFEVGIIPYEWIEHIDERGDEFGYIPQFFTNYKGHKKSPYKYLTYYIKSDVYHEDSDPMDMQWRSVDIVGN